MKNKIRAKLIKKTFANLNNIACGSLKIKTPKGVNKIYFGKENGANAAIHIKDWSVIESIVKRGDIGLGECYIEGKIEVENLENFMIFLTQNINALEEFAHGSLKNRIIFFIYNNILRRNSKGQSKKNIAAHYDVGNEFYKLWLDESLTYSSAIFSSPNHDLKAAQQEKYRRILNKISDAHKKHILEIGCGWGGFVEAASNAGHKVEAVTISKAQYEIAKNRAKNDSKVLLKDYREIQGLFDAIVSIEMFEAVGELYWKDYFKNVKNKLKKGGKAVIQTITIADDLFDDYRKRSDFIREYTFPGGMLPSKSRFKSEVEKAGLKCKEIFSFGQDYAKTLRLWLKNFDDKKHEIIKMGYDENFIRSWRFYLASCIAAFECARTDVVQVEIENL